MRGPFQPYPADQVHRLIEPGPTVLITTAGDEWPTVMTNGFNMPVRHDGLLAAVVGPWDATFSSLRRTGECVIAIPGADLLETTVDIGNCSSADVDKWVEFGISRIPAATVGAPLIGQCQANIECVIEDDSLVDRYSLWILRVNAAWVRPGTDAPEVHHGGNGTFTENGAFHDLRHRMTKWRYLT